MKRYTSREQILKDIDGALRKVKKAKEVAQEHLDQEELLTGIPDQIAQLRIHRESADFQFRKIKRLQDVRLVKLGMKLAEFDTASLLPDGNAPANHPHPPASPLQEKPLALSDDVLP